MARGTAIVHAFFLFSGMESIRITLSFVPSSKVTHELFQRSQTDPSLVQTTQHFYRSDESDDNDCAGVVKKGKEFRLTLPGKQPILYKSDVHQEVYHVREGKHGPLYRQQNMSSKIVTSRWYGSIKGVIAPYIKGQKVGLSKKKHASFHSRFSKAAVSLAFISLSPIWSPKFIGIVPKQLFSLAMDISTNQVMLMNAATAVLVVNMILGQFRFRRNTLRSRKVIFNTFSEVMWIYLLSGCSNLSVYKGSAYVLDAWSWPFKVLLSALVAKNSLSTAFLFHDIITGPKRGRLANPWYYNCAQGLFATTVYHLSTGFLVFGFLPIFDARSTYEAVTVPMIERLGASQCTLVASKLLVTFYLSMGAFFASLRFEKRISPRKGTLLLGFNLLFFLLENYRFIFTYFYSLNRGHAAASYLSSYTKAMCAKTYCATIWFLPSILAIVHGVLSVVRREYNNKIPRIATQGAYHLHRTN